MFGFVRNATQREGLVQCLRRATWSYNKKCMNEVERGRDTSERERVKREREEEERRTVGAHGLHQKFCSSPLLGGSVIFP